jgi:adenine-specific DNA-methyltransferase
MGYRFPKETMDDLLESGRILFGDDETKIVELKVYASEFREKLSSVLELDGRLGSYDLKEDFPSEGKVFTNPKPVRLFESFFPFIAKNDDDLIVDFFAGSGTTAKSIWRLTSRDSIRRRFCLIQLPEPLNPDDRDQKAAIQLCDSLGAPRLLSEITKERLRRAGAKIKADNPMFAGDTGFRVYKLAESNIRAWQPSGNLEQDLIDHVEHIVPDRSEADVLAELLLKLGLNLCVPIERREIAGKTVHSIGGGVLQVCLATRIGAMDAEPLALGIADWHTALAPAGDATCVFRDNAFENDVAKTNLAAILKQHGIAQVRSL